MKMSLMALLTALLLVASCGKDESGGASNTTNSNASNGQTYNGDYKKASDLEALFNKLSAGHKTSSKSTAARIVYKDSLWGIFNSGKTIQEKVIKIDSDSVLLETSQGDKAFILDREIKKWFHPTLRSGETLTRTNVYSKSLSLYGSKDIVKAYVLEHLITKTGWLGSTITKTQYVVVSPNIPLFANPISIDTEDEHSQLQLINDRYFNLY